MRVARVVVATALVLAIVAWGFGAAPSGKPTGLPNWAPKRTSKEFLRAAKVLKSLPAAAYAADAAHYVPDWELFGSLDDTQQAAFLKLTRFSLPLKTMSPASQEMEKHYQRGREENGNLIWYAHRFSVPVRELTARQRQLFDAVAKTWPAPHKQDRGGLLPRLAKLGAKKDLSNVEVGFATLGHVVSVTVAVQGAGGKPGVVSDDIGML